jgi:hypothetical protein
MTIRVINMSESKDESMECPHQNSASIVLIKIVLFTVFLCGVLMRIFAPFENFRHLADVLMWLAVLGRLFMYVRALSPALFLPKEDNSSSLRLIEKKEAIITTYDQRTRTPLERVIEDR